MVEKAPKQFTYQRHKPEETTLYKLVQENWRTFEAQVVRDTGYHLPDFVIKEFNEYLRCGILLAAFCVPNARSATTRFSSPSAANAADSAPAAEQGA